LIRKNKQIINLLLFAWRLAFWRMTLRLLRLILVGVGFIAGAKARADLKAKYPPVGQMVDVGGYRLHLYCQGRGSPTVLIEAGQGDFGLSWGLVQPEAAKSTRVCVYDRAGLGWSDPSPRPRTVQVMVDELHTLLTTGAQTRPITADDDHARSGATAGRDVCPTAT